MARKKIDPKSEIQKVLDKTDLDEKVVAKINDLLEEPKSFIARLKATTSIWTGVELGTIFFIIFPLLDKNYAVSLGATLVWVALHKFNKIWLK